MTPKTEFIMGVQDEIEHLVKPILERSMTKYSVQFNGFTHDDLFMWLACGIKHQVICQAAKAEAISVGMDETEKED